jgi:uncharacterized protein YbaA (DUF1428 family)
MTYVDGFVVPVPEDRVEDYRAMAEKAGKVWMEHGALAFRECVADDVPDGKTTDFKRAVKLEEGETVVFAWIVYESREQRDEINKKVMDDPRIEEDMKDKDIPFDAKRMIYGGFRTLVDL